MRTDPNADLRALLEDWQPAPPMGAGRSHRPAGSPPPEAEGLSTPGAAGPVGAPRRGGVDRPVSGGHQPSQATPPAAATEAVQRGDVVTWRYNAVRQVGVVQSIGRDGRVWLRLLDHLGAPHPLWKPAAELRIIATRQLLTELAAEYDQ